MRRVCMTMLAALLLVSIFPVSALAEGEEAVPASLKIDDTNIYEGMDKAYKYGYTPQVSGGVVTLVMPLIADGEIQNSQIIVTPTLGDTASSPFQYKNYQKTIALAQNKVNGGNTTVASYLVRFDLPLASGRINGVYPVTINIQAQGAGGSAIQQSFTCYVTITDGKNPNATTEPETETPTSQPKIIVSGYQINPYLVEAGGEFTATITLRNTSEKKSVQNMLVTVSFDCPGASLLGESNVLYIDKLGKGKTTEIKINYKTDLNTAAQTYNISLSMEYDNSDAMSLSSAGTVPISVAQPLRVELEAPQIAKEVNAGDTLPLSFQVMNLSRSAVYNVRVELSAPGLIPTGTAFIGNMEAGTSSAADMDAFIGTKNMTDGNEDDDKYGLTSGVITLIYEDAVGQEYTQGTEFSTTIGQPVIAASTTQSEEEPEKASQWWISLVIGAAIIAGLVTTLLLRRKRRERAHADI